MIAVSNPSGSLSCDSSHRSSSAYRELQELLVAVIRAFTSAIDAKDDYTAGHSERVARIATRLGRHLELPASQVSRLYLAGLLHDIGKIGVSDNVLKKPGALTEAEYRHVMGHVEIGVAILRELKQFRHLIPAILHHHERYAGDGYPDGLRGEAIPRLARILAVADGFDAMHHDRVYRPRYTPEEVGGILRRGAGVQWDPDVVQAAIDCWPELIHIERRGLGDSVRVAVHAATNGQSDRNRVPGTYRRPEHCHAGSN